MIRPAALVDPPLTSASRTPFSDTAEADDRVFHIVHQQAAWVAPGGDPQGWLFAERSRFLREGTCDPWAAQMLAKAGLLPRR